MVKEVDLVVVETKVALVELEIENHQTHHLLHLIKVILAVLYRVRGLTLVPEVVVPVLLVELELALILLTQMLVMVVMVNHYLLSQPQF
tara:strand:- start:14 stop:280 length:267 start_codon:yes stop_codon:yes gene_type:complete